MYIEDCFYYDELDEFGFNSDYLEMMEYTIRLYKEGKISSELTISDMSSIKMELIDLDAIRWYNGFITTQELYNQYKQYFLRQ